MRPDLILALLRKDPRNSITAFHRCLGSSGGEGRVLSGGATAGMTLNIIEPYYEGWAPSLANSAIYINRADIWPIRDYLNAEPWGDQNLGGTRYTLRANVDSSRFTWFKTPAAPEAVNIPSPGETYRHKFCGMQITIESVKLGNKGPTNIIYTREDGLRVGEPSWARFKSDFTSA